MTLAERMVVVDLDDGEVWFSVTGAMVMDVMAEGRGQYLHHLFAAKIPGLENTLVCMAPASWLRGDLEPDELEGMEALAATATTAARETAGITLQ
jgi:sarcosine oxidase gamma subunit